jgi:hypothetical protein
MVLVHDFVRGFVLETAAILAPLVLKTVFVFASYLNGSRSSLAMAGQLPLQSLIWQERLCETSAPQMFVTGS